MLAHTHNHHTWESEVGRSLEFGKKKKDWVRGAAATGRGRNTRSIEQLAALTSQNWWVPSSARNPDSINKVQHNGGHQPRLHTHANTCAKRCANETWSVFNTNTAPNSIWCRTLKSVFCQTRDATQLVDCLLACTKPWIAVPIPEKPVCAYSPSTPKGRGRRVRNPRPFLASSSATQHVKKPTWNTWDPFFRRKKKHVLSIRAAITSLAWHYFIN